MLLGARRKKISMFPEGLPSSVTVADFLVMQVHRLCNDIQIHRKVIILTSLVCASKIIE
jgi:hypothetical protein